MRDLYGNAHRIANVLLHYSEDERAVKRLADILNYVPSQLSEDMRELQEYINELERKLEGECD